MRSVRIMDRPEDFERLGINPGHVEAWEDGRRGDDAPGHNEVWYFDAIFDDGGKLVLGFRPKRPNKMRSAGDWPDFNIAVTPPGGQTRQEFVELDAGECSFSSERCDLRYGKSYVRGDFRSYEIHVEGARGLGCDLRYEAVVEPFRQGTGIIEFDGDPGVYYTDLPVVKCRVEGEVTCDGRTRRVSGWGYHDHQWMSISPLKAFHHWLWGHLYTPNYTLYIYDFVTTRERGFAHVPFFGVQDNATSGTLFMTDGGMELSTTLEMQEKLGEAFPRRSRYVFENADGSRCAFDIEWREEIEVREPKTIFNLRSRALLRLMGVHPTYVRYYAHGAFRLELADGRVVEEEGDMIYEYNYMGKPDPRAGV